MCRNYYESFAKESFPFPHFLSISNRDKLPDDHPDKPKGFFEQAVAKAQASLEAEAAAFAGCKVEIMVRFLFIVQSYVFLMRVNPSFFRIFIIY